MLLKPMACVGNQRLPIPVSRGPSGLRPIMEFSRLVNFKCFSHTHPNTNVCCYTRTCIIKNVSKSPAHQFLVSNLPGPHYNEKE